MPSIKFINGYPFAPIKAELISTDEILHQSKKFLENMLNRRSVRYFSDKPVSKEIITNILSVANSAPSCANKQPWTFCAIQNIDLKKQIREAAKKKNMKAIMAECRKNG